MNLILKEDPKATWPGTDYNVFHDGRRVGRILTSHHAPKDRPWSWHIHCSPSGDLVMPASPSNHGHAETRDVAAPEAFQAARHGTTS